MQRQGKGQEVIVVAVDINRKDDCYEKFVEQSSDQQLNALVRKLQFICETLGSQHSGKRWIVAWRDYGITGVGLSQRAVSGEFKNRYKQALSQFVQQYPNLTIVAGTVATEKEGSKYRLERIQRSYEELADYHHQEKHTVGSRTEAQEFDAHINELEDVKKASHHDDVDFRVIRNTCYVFTADPEISDKHVVAVRKHSKTTPQADSKVTTFSGLKIFHPGDKDSKNPIMHISGGLKIATEVCREHDFAVARTEAAKQGIPDTDILLHFVLSDSIKLIPDNFFGHYVLQLDSVNKPRLIVANADNAPGVSLYQVNLLEQDNHIKGPLAPLQELFANRIVREFEEMIARTTDKNKRKLLEHMRDKFKESSTAFISSTMYETLEKYFTSEKIRATLCVDEKKGLFDTFIQAMSAKPKPPSKAEMQKWIERMLTMTAEEKKEHPEYQAYVSKSDSPVLKK